MEKGLIMSIPIEINSSINLEDFKKVLDEHNLKNSIKERQIFDKIHKYIEFDFPVARNHEEIRVYDDDDLETILDTDFVKYRGISNYEAIWSSELKSVECEIQEPRLMLPSRFLFKRLAQIFEVCEEYKDDMGMVNPSEVLLFKNDTFKITVGFCSKQFAFLSWYKDGRRVDLKKLNERYRITLKIENIDIETEETAKKLLEKISNTLFYQIDVLCDFAITIAPRRRTREERMSRMRREPQKDIDNLNLTLDYEYDNVPMSLYWFALSNTESPIFMYFALYQVLEYYFPIYSTVEIKERIRNLMKVPGFNINSETDMMNLLKIMSSNGVNSLGDEREQLDNVLRHIVVGEDVSTFIKEREYLKDYYSGKESKKISDKKLRLDDNIGIIEDLANRIYDIRCRIVHNKASETSKKILPKTREESLLRNEIDVLKFVVQKTMIVNSKPLLVD